MNPHTAQPTPTGNRHAVVIGGSMAGLLASAMLSKHFDRVTLVERDQLPAKPEERKGVPQGRHVHALLKKGEIILTQLFPNFSTRLLESGGECVDAAEDIGWFHFGDWKKRFRSNLTFHCQSRGLLEWNVRACVAAKPNVNFIDECDVASLLTHDDGRRVTGVKILRRDASAAPETLAADLVVDASGRGSKVTQWLEALGYSKPEESTVKINVGYASRIYRRSKEFKPDWRGLLVYPTPPEKRLGAIAPIEGDRWLITLGGLLGDHPPAEEAGFLEFARSLAAPDVYLAIKNSEPLTPIVIHKLPSNLRRHYERMPRFPEGFVVLGDALCSFNPIYGQGMSVAGKSVIALDECLQDQRRRAGDDLTGLSRRFQQQAARIIDGPWLLATSEDLRYAETEGHRPFWLPLLNWYVGELHQLCAYDEEVLLNFLHVMHMTARAEVLFQPRIMWRVLTWRWQHRAASKTALPQPALPHSGS